MELSDYEKWTVADFFDWGMVDRWFARPSIDRRTYFIPDCAEFKLQRWIERDPLNRMPLAVPRWYPEEDLDGDGVPNSPRGPGASDFIAGAFLPNGNEFNRMEYCNGANPMKAANVANIITPPANLGYVGAAGPWIYCEPRDVPKAIKVTVRLFDEHERIEGGQEFTMVFEIPGVQRIE
jgi:hypothetical protein